MSYGTWCNGGVWPQHQGIMDIAVFPRRGIPPSVRRLGSHASARGGPIATTRLLPGGAWPRGRANRSRPYCFCFDAWGPAAGILRGLFEYGYTADGVRLWPHLPPESPATFRKYQWPSAKPASTSRHRHRSVKKALVNGKPAKLDTDGSLFVPLTALSAQRPSSSCAAML